jgi:hypothetical protein
VKACASRSPPAKPRRFRLGGREIEIGEVLDQWFGANCRYCKVKGDDRALYILRFDEDQSEWTLTMYPIVRVDIGMRPEDSSGRNMDDLQFASDFELFACHGFRCHDSSRYLYSWLLVLCRMVCDQRCLAPPSLPRGRAAMRFTGTRFGKELDPFRLPSGRLQPDTRTTAIKRFGSVEPHQRLTPGLLLFLIDATTVRRFPANNQFLGR